MKSDTYCSIQLQLGKLNTHHAFPLQTSSKYLEIRTKPDDIKAFLIYLNNEI